MDASSDESIKQVLAALEVFSGKPDKTSLEQANAWLQNFQHLPESWPTCNTLLLSPSVPEVGRTFAAQTFRAKVTHDLHQLDASQRAGLRDTLVTAIQQYAAGPRVILIQICLALSGLALQMKEWNDAVTDLINALGTNPTMVPALLQFLTVLPEEVSSNTRIPMSNDDFRYQETRLLTANAPEVLKLLTMYSQANGITPAVQGQIFSCIRSWLLAGELTATMIAETPLFELAFQGLAWDELFEDAVDLICSLIHETQEIDDNMTVIQAIIPQVIALRPKLTAAAEAEDSDKVRGYCRIYTEAGETYRLLLLAHPDAFFPIVDAISECAAFSDLDIVPITFHFWFRLAQSIGKKPDVPQMFFEAYKTLMGVIIKHLHFPANPETMTPQERDEFRGFRHVMGDTLKDCCYVLGTDGCLLTAYEMINESMSRSASTGGTLLWQEIEAPLFAMRSMGAEVNPDDDEIMPKIMDLIPRLPSHPRVRYAAIMVISRYTEWTDRHPTYIPFQLTYVSSGFDDPDPEVAAASGQAMKYLCKDCKQHLVPFLPQLHTFVQTMGSKLLQDDRVQVYEAIGYVITSMSMEDAGQSLRLFALDLVQQIHSVVSKPQAVGKDELIVVADALELLEAMLHVVVSFGDDLPTACSNTAAEVYPVLDTLIEKYGSHYFISEKACRVLRQGMQFFGRSAVPLVPPVVQRITLAFRTTGYSSFLWLQEKIVAFYGTYTDPALQASIQEAYNISSAQVLEIIKVQTADAVPDVVEDFVHLLIQTLDFCPDYLFLSPSFPGAFQATMTALTLVHQDIIFPALDLLRSLLGHEALNPSSTTQHPNFPRYAVVIQQAVTTNGLQLVALLLAGLLGHFPEDSVHLVISIFRILAGVWPSELAAWLPPVVEQLPAASLPLVAKTQFLNDVGNALSSHNVDQMKQAIVTLNRAARKSRERMRNPAISQ